MTCVQLRTMTNFNISKNMLCKVGISYSLCSATVSLTVFLLIFANEIEQCSNHFLQIKVIHDISKQTEQRAGIGTIFARWHLAITIISLVLNGLTINTSSSKLMNYVPLINKPTGFSTNENKVSNVSVGCVIEKVELLFLKRQRC